jgi:hypothetical protein
MERIIIGDKIFSQYEYSKEEEFEKHVIENADEIFGSNSVYIDIKKRIKSDNIVTIPDGYLIDLTFESSPALYMIENELVAHDPYKHIGQQLLKFAISYKGSGRSIKKFLLENIKRDKEKLKRVELGFKKAGYENIDAFFEDLIFEKPVRAIVIIDEVKSDLENVLSQLSMNTDIIELKAYTRGTEFAFKFTPFQQDIQESKKDSDSKIDIEELDTIVVPANEEGFNEVFLGENCWYSIRLSSSMIDRVKYIAGYQTAPISAITYYAEVSHIEKYKDTNKYILYFTDKAKKIGPIKLIPKPKGIATAPQAPRYTDIKKLKKAKTLDDVF